MQKRNYQKELDAIIAGMEPTVLGLSTAEFQDSPSLLLHSCCAPCSSYTLEYLRRHFRITVLYYNPNIMRREEYEKREGEQQRLIEEFNLEDIEAFESSKILNPSNFSNPSNLSNPSNFSNLSNPSNLSKEISFLPGRYDPRKFTSAVRGLEDAPEGGERCRICYRLRLEEAARTAKEKGFDYFCTTLSISPLKHADWLNEIGEELAEKYGLRWLPSDFKKRGGYQRSIELSKEHNLYRQNFCGCEYSRKASGQPPNRLTI